MKRWSSQLANYKDWDLRTCQALRFACGRARHRATRSFPMPDTAIDPIPKQGKFRRALAAVGAWAPSARLHRLRLHPRPHRTLGAGAGTAKGRVAPKPRGDFQRCSPRWRRQPRTLTAASGAVVISAWRAKAQFRPTHGPLSTARLGVD